MKIVNSTLGMDASTVYREVDKVAGQLKADSGPLGGSDGFYLNLGSSGIGLLRNRAIIENSSIQAASNVVGNSEGVQHCLSEQEIVGRVVTEVLGQQVNIRTISLGQQENFMKMADVDNDVERNALMSNNGLRLSLGMRRLEYREENLCIRSSGKVETEDGRSVELKLELSLKREEFTNISAYANVLSSRFIDPLVLSFTDGLTVLGDSRFNFDLDCDGEAEEINSLKSGSGFLVLDGNGDGIVNDGRELFGPTTGFGYSELNIYDVDNNNWIDENDPVFDDLQLWMGGMDSSKNLISLREAGVGAISLASTDVHFNLKDRAGRIIGQVRNSGLFLTEAGEVRPLSEIDLTVDTAKEIFSEGRFREEIREAIQVLQLMLAARRQRSFAAMAALKSADRAEYRRDRLLERLLELQDDKPQLPG